MTRAAWFAALVWPSAAVVQAADVAGSVPGFTYHEPDSYLARVESLALLETLNATLLSHDSATATLEQWCADHHMASVPKIVADREPGADKPLDDEQRRQLQIGATEIVRYRRVRLRCGEVVMSEADNWYVPSRLTTAMNRELEGTDTPFGKVVQPLKFQRHTLSSTLLWQPLPSGWELGAASQSVSAVPLRIPSRILQQRAVLSLPDGTPFSEVIETYSGSVLAFRRNPR